MDGGRRASRSFAAFRSHHRTTPEKLSRGEKLGPPPEKNWVRPRFRVRARATVNVRSIVYTTKQAPFEAEMVAARVRVRAEDANPPLPP